MDWNYSAFYKELPHWTDQDSYGRFQLILHLSCPTKKRNSSSMKLPTSHDSTWRSWSLIKTCWSLPKTSDANVIQPLIEAPLQAFIYPQVHGHETPLQRSSPEFIVSEFLLKPSLSLTFVAHETSLEAFAYPQVSWPWTPILQSSSSPKFSLHEALIEAIIPHSTPSPLRKPLSSPKSAIGFAQSC